MKIKVLVDNMASGRCEAAHGFSLWVEADRKVLFDLGPSDLFKRNANVMGIDLEGADAIVLSHGHWDHGNGLEYLEGKRLITHPHAFERRFRKRDFSYLGLPLDRNEARRHFDLIETIEPFWISPNMVFLGEIPRGNDFEAQTTEFLLEDGSPDFVMDDSALVIKYPKGLVVISGCAHAGICNTISYAQKVCEESRVFAVLGGFHLKSMDDVAHRVIQQLQRLGVEHVWPSHCTGFPVESEFYRIFGGLPLQAGAVLEL